MKTPLLLTLAFAATFAVGFAVRPILTSSSTNGAAMKRVTGIGGIVFKCNDPGKMHAWYKTHLGINTSKYGAVLR